jgi:hypothetical protein
MSEQRKTQPNRVPFRVGLIAALIAIALSVLGMWKNSATTNFDLESLLLVIPIAGGSWGVVAWAITTAVYDVEEDIAQQEEALPEADSPDKPAPESQATNSGA